MRIAHMILGIAAVVAIIGATVAVAVPQEWQYTVNIVTAFCAGVAAGAVIDMIKV